MLFLPVYVLMSLTIYTLIHHHISYITFSAPLLQILLLLILTI